MSITRLAFFYFALSMPGIIGKATADTGKLHQIATDLKSSFPKIGHLSAADFAKMVEGDESVILVDVRREAEFDVSRIEGAIRISPRASAKQVSAALGPLAAGKTVVFYCSVGVRSSRLANKSRHELEALGARGIYNLSGGIFAWHNKGHPLVDDDGPTDLVHPYDRSWGKLLNHQESVSLKPSHRHAR